MGNKILTSVLIILIIASSSAGLFYPKKAKAVVPVHEVGALLKTTVTNWAKEAANWVSKHADDAALYALKAAEWAWEQKNTALKIAVAYFRKKLLDIIVSEIVEWIQGGGKPKFVTDWKGFLKDAADSAGIQVMTVLEKQGTIPAGLTNALCNPKWAAYIKASIWLPQAQTFKYRASCTLSDVGANFKSFMNNFQEGKWGALVKLTEPQNNPYGLFLMTSEEITRKQTEAVNAAANRALSGAGFLSHRVCKELLDFESGDIETGSWKADEIDPTYCLKWETISPGKMLADMTSFVAEKTPRWLLTNEEWESYVVAITDALINRLVKEGITALTSADISDSGGSSPLKGMDKTPPKTKAVVVDETHVKLVSNEDALIYYTTDGTIPTLSSKVYGTPIEIKETTTLKWFGRDYAGNTEETIHTQTFTPPLTKGEEEEGGGGGETESFSTAMAVDTHSVALVASKPATIYYTTNGKAPTKSNGKKYVKKITLQENKITHFKWRAITTDGEKEKTQQLFLLPPFPDASLTTIYNLVEPVAKIDAPQTATGGEFFPLDPSSSSDPDDSNQIIMYEWDFDNDGNYDWWTVDYDRDGVFDKTKYKGKEGIGNGFEGLNQQPNNSVPGALEVKFKPGSRTITLRVTDNEGLYTTTSATIEVQ